MDILGAALRAGAPLRGETTHDPPRRLNASTASRQSTTASSSKASGGHSSSIQKPRQDVRRPFAGVGVVLDRRRAPPRSAQRQGSLHHEGRSTPLMDAPRLNWADIPLFQRADRPARYWTVCAVVGSYVVPQRSGVHRDVIAQCRVPASVACTGAPYALWWRSRSCLCHGQSRDYWIIAAHNPPSRHRHRRRLRRAFALLSCCMCLRSTVSLATCLDSSWQIVLAIGTKRPDRLVSVLSAVVNGVALAVLWKELLYSTFDPPRRVASSAISGYPEYPFLGLGGDNDRDQPAGGRNPSLVVAMPS